MSTLSGSSPVFVSDNHLRLKRSSLLNVYLNYKFEFSLLTSHLFFSLFILMFTTSVGYRLGLLMSTTCLNCARFYDGVKLFSFKRVYIRFSNFCQLLAKSTRQNWFSKKVHFLQIYKHGESVTLCSKFQSGFDLQRLSTFLDGWGVLEDDGLLSNFLRRRLFQPIEFSLSKFDRLDPSYQTSKANIR